MWHNDVPAAENGRRDLGGKAMQRCIKISLWSHINSFRHLFKFGEYQ